MILGQTIKGTVGFRRSKSSFYSQKHTNPEYGFSIRLLNATHTGGLLRGRRDSDDVEVDIKPDSKKRISLDSPVINVAGDTGDTTATKLGEFAACSGYDDPDGLGSADTVYVPTIFNQFGSNDAEQSVKASQGELINNGTLQTKNNLAGIQLVGLYSIDVVASTTTSLGIFMVHTPHYEEANGRIFTQAAAGTHDYALSGSYIPLARRQSTGDIGSYDVDDSQFEAYLSYTVNTQALIMLIHDGSTLSHYKNNDDDSDTTSFNLSISVDDYSINNALYNYDARDDGILQECIIYENNDPSSERTSIRDDILDYFDIS